MLVFWFKKRGLSLVKADCFVNYDYWNFFSRKCAQQVLMIKNSKISLTEISCISTKSCEKITKICEIISNKNVVCAKLQGSGTEGPIPPPLSDYVFGKIYRKKSAIHLNFIYINPLFSPNSAIVKLVKWKIYNDGQIYVHK